jgi:hypothetical protein
MKPKIINANPKKSCKKCSPKEKLKSIPIGWLLLSIFTLFASFYGTIEIIKDIISLF